MPTNRLKIYFSTNGHWSTSGYGQQAAELLPLIQEAGYPLAEGAFYGLEGAKTVIDDILVYPKLNHIYGSDAMVHHARDFKADVTFTLQDIWILNPQDLQQTKRWIPYIPIDHEPIPPGVLERLQFAYRIITYSKFGQEELKRNGYHSEYIPHTVDTEVFKPVNKKEQQKLLGFPEDSYLVGMVAANKDNPPRKSFQEVMEAFQVFLQKTPNAYLYLHTNPDQPGGFPIRSYANMLGITPRVLFPDMYMMGFKMGKKEMSMIYNCFDVLLAPSQNEGFGVPVIEAGACGVPVVVNNFTAQPELVKNHITGEICDVASKRFDQLLSYVAIPSSKSIYECMMRIKESKQEAMSKAAREHIVANYDTKTIFKTKWAPYLEMLENEIYKT